MEPFIVSARKYRPQTFKDVVGQQAITNTLTNAIDNDHLAQALLFTGPRGVGKTTCARILAKRINQDGRTDENEDFAFNIFELDAASNNSVDDIRELTSQVRIPPQVGKYKVYIIDEVHMLSQAAFNAFLKTLEEPPAHAIFILATTEKHKIIPTILSRCQIFDFKRITVKDAAEYLKYIAENQEIEAEDDALHIIAQKADGAMRDALSIFDRVVSYSGKKLTRKAVTENLNVLDYDTYFAATDLILQHDIPGLLVLFNDTLARGFDGHHFINGLASHFRDLMVCRHHSTIALLEVGEEAKKHYGEQSKNTTGNFLLSAIDMANDCDIKYKSSKNQRLLVELTLMKLASIDFDGEKKKSESLGNDRNAPDFIIPASFYKVGRPKEEDGTVKSSETLAKTVKSAAPTIESTIAEESPSVPTSTSQKLQDTKGKGAINTQEPDPAPRTQINIKSTERRVSGLSLSSLKTKKEHQLNKKENVIDESNLPKANFTEEEMQKHWADFVDILDNDGRKILASNLHSDIPKLIDNFTLWIELPNGTMKKEIEREKYDLIEYLKQKLNNHFIQLRITVNEATAKKFAFTPEEKYQKLREKNPAIDLLRKEFDLDI
ncbi:MULTISPECIES: DNA polymerase III subunit gamma/tau [unclassified Arenibacter]|uniref:DNA polymerase III subunit gamma/tau n=1 Tax=unclassified Arenibacter TaxID=2615047 RepID=UPI000E34AB91|nr:MULTISPECIES: DNA polymerase III subunit gamma/tau [unclassified Arenibacter]MCM4165176.1 DNA polymerase III subunit gamma/tau [Arenibacter sp. A80]RFT55203.1 DNA polymerase III subunit gamma/tau [Arenibacter sp. P308M17]